MLSFILPAQTAKSKSFRGFARGNPGRQICVLPACFCRAKIGFPAAFSRGGFLLFRPIRPRSAASCGTEGRFCPVEGGDGIRETLDQFCRRTGRAELLSQWNAVRNLPLTADSVSSGSSRRVWWQCAQGHQWQCAVYARTTSGSKCPYCAGKLPVPGENDLATRFPNVASEWHPTKNSPLTPNQVLPGSHRLVWWACGKGHEWQAIVKSRAAGCGCPVCANRGVQPGDNDLATTHPELAKEWHPSKNGALTPRDVTAGSHRKVWWICEKGHEWQAEVSSRTANGTGCPVCAGKVIVPGENDLQSLFPDIAKEWHPTLNGTATPDTISPYSSRKVWWVCEKGHPYQATAASRTMHGGGCPYCAGRRVLHGFNDLATVDPNIAGQWNQSLNGNLTPEMVTAGSRKKVWWQCSEGHVWKAAVYARTGKQRSGCPVCAGRGKRRAYERMEQRANGGASRV